MTYHPLLAAELAFDDKGTPYAPAYDDVYHSTAGGIEQARHVFLGGNELPARWHDRAVFTVLETGFGLGLNFLATWQAWRDDPARCGRLHFVSVEKHPFQVEDLAQLHAAWPELAPLATQLRAQWPLLLPGLHRLHFGDVTLTLAFGDALDLLPQLELQADAFFLDGFAPAKNPALWSDAVVSQLRRLAGPAATLATWSVAAEVAKRLAGTGFILAKRPGFGGKYGMLTGYLPGGVPHAGHFMSPAPTMGRWQPADSRLARPDLLDAAGGTIAASPVVVIGAGIAGTSIAERLAARGVAVTLLDAADTVAAGASGNPVGIIRPLPSSDDNRLSRWVRAGYLHATRHLQALSAEGLTLSWSPCGVLHLARDAQHAQTQRHVIATQKPPPDFARFVEREEAAKLAGWPVASGGWWFAGGAWIAPPSLCQANLLRHGGRVATHLQARVSRIERRGNCWRVFDASDALLAESCRLVLAAGADIQRLLPQRLLPVWPGRGTVSLLPAATTPSLDSAQETVICRMGYVSPAIAGFRSTGATLSRDDDTQPRMEDHVENLARLDHMLPGYAEGLDPAHIAGRTSFRPMSPDRLPLAGALPPSAGEPADGLYVLSGFGARGLVWATLTAELLASTMCNEPLPVTADLAAACDPRRYLIKPPRSMRP